MLLARFFYRLIRTGSLTMIDTDGRRYEMHGGPGPRATIRLHDPALHRTLILNPSLHIGEAYMNGTLTIEDGTLYDFLDVCTLNADNLDTLPFAGLARGFGRYARKIRQHNPARRAKSNVAHHYDLSATLYDLFLDADRQYSCAYFDSPEDSLDTAQHNKKRHLAAKLLLDRPGLRVLDIGCGWGGLALYLAAETGAEVTGITLSEEQYKVAQERAAKAGLANKVKFHLVDYRYAEGEYDRIVSVGMFEHVGVPHYPAFFRKLKSLLAPDGVALLHAIGRLDGPGTTNPWIRKYIFPGGYTPALSEVLPVIERERLIVTDVEILRLHYAETLRNWRERFNANRDRIKALYDERFCRMWEFYLAGCELAFRNQLQMVNQIQMARRIDTVPLTRDYITDWERAHGRRPEKVA